MESVKKILSISEQLSQNESPLSQGQSYFNAFCELTKTKTKYHELEEIDVGLEAILVTKFNSNGQLLATAGNDSMIRIFCARSVFNYYSKARKNCQEEGIFNVDSCPESEKSIDDSLLLPLFATFEGHQAAVFDLAWTINNFLYSLSLDKSVRVWHVTRNQCLAVFQHSDYVNTISVLPTCDKFFITVTFDATVRMWDLNTRKVVVSRNVKHYRDNRNIGTTLNIITSSCFIRNGQHLLLGTNNGCVLMLEFYYLKFLTLCHIHKKRNPKVTSMQSYGDRKDKVLVSTSDSKVYILRINSLSVEKLLSLKGCTINTSLIHPTISPDHRYVACGSEGRLFHIWNNTVERRGGKLFHKKSMKSFKIGERKRPSPKTCLLTSSIESINFLTASPSEAVVSLYHSFTNLFKTDDENNDLFKSASEDHEKTLTGDEISNSFTADDDDFNGTLTEEDLFNTANDVNEMIQTESMSSDLFETIPNGDDNSSISSDDEDELIQTANTTSELMKSSSGSVDSVDVTRLQTTSVVFAPDAQLFGLEHTYIMIVSDINGKIHILGKKPKN